MTQPISPRFLQRIAPYPAVVQEALKAEVTPAVMEKAVRIMHGTGIVKGTPPSQPMLMDSLLARLVRSQRFIQRTQQIFARLEAGDTEGSAGNMRVLLSPLADTEQPYYIKIREAALAQQKQDPNDPLVDLLTLLDDLRNTLRLDPAQPLGQLIANQIRLAATGGAAGYLDALFAALGHNIQFTPEDATIHAPRNMRVLRGVLIRHLLASHRNNRDLTTLDTLALNAIADCQAKGHLRTLLPPREIALVFDAQPNEDDIRAWQATEFRLNGTADRRLRIAPDRRISDIGAAFLTTAALGPASALHITDCRIENGQITWPSRIRGYRDVGTADTTALLWDGAEPAETGIELRIAALPVPAPDHQRAMPLHDAYAIVLAEDGVTLSSYTNIENCAVYTGADRLRADLANAGPHVLRKPVLVIGRRSPQSPDYIVSLVPAYWARTGAHAVSTSTLEYDSNKGVLHPRPAAAISLTRLLSPHTSALPAKWWLSLGGLDRAMETGVLILSDDLAVTQPLASGPALQDLDRLKRALNDGRLTLCERDRIQATGRPGYTDLLQANTPRNWAISKLVVRETETYLVLRSDLDLCVGTSENDHRIFDALERDMSQLAELVQEFDRFAMLLGSSPARMAKLSDPHLLQFLHLARFLPSANHVAADLALHADQLATRGSGIVVPLFEMLACCLPRPAFMATLLQVFHCLLALSMKPDNGAPHKFETRLLFRITEIARRYADDTTLAFILTRLARQHPDLLAQSGMARCFQRLLDAPQLPVLLETVGSQTLDTVRGTLDFRDVFRRAVIAQDRDRILSMIANPSNAGNADFSRWMDSLRSLSNELRALHLEGVTIQGADGLYNRKLAAVIMSDRPTLAEFRDSGLLEVHSDIDVVAHNILGDNTALNRLIAARFEGTDLPAPVIEGTSASDVFVNAARSLKHLMPSTEGPVVTAIVSAYEPDIDLMRLSLQSLADQSHADVEIIVVDDASTPAVSAEIASLVASFANARYLRVPINSGPYVGRNLAIAEARGEFIAIQDADDWSHPGRFAAQINAFRTMPELQVVTTPHIRVDRAGCVQLEAQFAIFGDGPMTSMFRRSVFDTVGAFAKVRSRGDVEMRERIAAFFGAQSMMELGAPVMLCFADSATLSQRTKAEAAEHLQLFRANIARRPPLAGLRGAGQDLGEEHMIVVPQFLRPTGEDI
ncbi:glycosyltransferase family A protein [Falsirhodobacter sp. alg1]|uniref:glycosyltransferase family A protein n=1 Tax=Falsirhodobacter sp. alg1 TaxID=1472418 RepID=UPI0007887EAC|nr:glycosyltransferase family A protein [Falsirhodobacter sp. alg1]